MTDEGESHLFVTNVKDRLIAYMGDSVWQRDQELHTARDLINHITWSQYEGEPTTQKKPTVSPRQGTEFCWYIWILVCPIYLIHSRTG